MSLLLRNLFIIFGFSIFIISIASADVSAGNSTKISTQTPSSKTVPPVAPQASEGAIERVNINSADAESLQKIKGFGKKKSQAVVEYRTKNGPFNSLEDLLKVKCRGLNKKWLDKMSKFLVV